MLVLLYDILLCRSDYGVERFVCLQYLAVDYGIL